MRYTGFSRPLANKVKVAGAGEKGAEAAVGVEVLSAVPSLGTVEVGDTAVGGMLVAGAVAADAVAGASDARAVGTTLGTIGAVAVGNGAVALGSGALAGTHAETRINSQTNNRRRRLTGEMVGNRSIFPL